MRKFLYAFYKKHIWLLRIIALFFMGLMVAIGIALSQVNLESLRGNILSVLRDSTNMPVEIDGNAILLIPFSTARSRQDL